MSFWQENHGKVKLHPFPCMSPGGAWFWFVPLLVTFFFFSSSLALFWGFLDLGFFLFLFFWWSNPRMSMKTACPLQSQADLGRAWAYLSLYPLYFSVPVSSFEGTVVIVMTTDLYRYIYIKTWDKVEEKKEEMTCFCGQKQNTLDPSHTNSPELNGGYLHYVFSFKKGPISLIHSFKQQTFLGSLSLLSTGTPMHIGCCPAPRGQHGLL